MVHMSQPGDAEDMDRGQDPSLDQNSRLVLHIFDLIIPFFKVSNESSEISFLSLLWIDYLPFELFK